MKTTVRQAEQAAEFADGIQQEYIGQIRARPVLSQA